MAAKKPTKAPRKKTAKINGAEPVIDSAAEFEQLLRKAEDGQHYVLRLYVTGSTSRSAQAIKNVHALCEEHLKGNYELEVIDIYQQPNEAAAEQIIAAPTLVKQLPEPVSRLIGDLSDRDRVLVGLKLTEPNLEDTKWMKL